MKIETCIKALKKILAEEGNIEVIYDFVSIDNGMEEPDAFYLDVDEIRVVTHYGRKYAAVE